MEKVKEFLKDTKKTAILGLISSILIFCDETYNLILGTSLLSAPIFITIRLILLNLQHIGFLVYFIILLMRLYKKKGNIKLANYILVFSLIISLFLQMFNIFQNLKYNISFYNIAFLIMFLINAIYIDNILLKKVKIKIITNNVFLIVNIIICLSVTFVGGFSLISALYYLIYLLRIPYFYNYYELLKS